MIKTEKLAKRFGDLVAVNDLSLQVAEGEIFGFLGPNGAGKTTTIRMLCGLIEPSGGRAWISGYEVGKESAKVRASIGLLTEAPGLYELLSAWDNMMFYADLHQIPAADARKRVQETMEWLNLWERRKDSVATFSKGMKQKLAIGRALIHRPQVIFLDEPTAGLDAESAHAVRDAIVALKTARRTIFLSTHNMDEADRLCDRIAIFKSKILQLDTPINLRRRFGVGTRRIRVKLRCATLANLLEDVTDLPYIQHASLTENGSSATLEVNLDDPDNQNPLLVRYLVENGVEVQFVDEQTATLEEVYLSLTGK